MSRRAADPAVVPKGAARLRAVLDGREGRGGVYGRGGVDGRGVAEYVWRGRRGGVALISGREGREEGEDLGEYYGAGEVCAVVGGCDGESGGEGGGAV